MDSSTLLWTVDATRGSVNFGRLIPFAGNTYELVFAGVAIEEEYTAYVMDESGLKCLAKSEHNAGEYTIAFNTADLRGEFERNMHEMQTFHVIVRDSKRVVAEGDLSVQWQSLWEDITTGEVYTMKGDPGKQGEPGKRGLKGDDGDSAYDVAVKEGFVGTKEEWLQTLKGNPGSLVMVQKIDANNEETGKWHNVYVKLDQNGRLRLVIDKTEKDPDPSTDVYVARMGDVTVGGVKTFSQSPLVPEVSKLDDNGNLVIDFEDQSKKAVSTSYLQKWWAAVKAAAVSLTDIVTFTKRLIVHDTEVGHPTMNVDTETDTVIIQGSLAVSGTETHSGTENHGGEETHSGVVKLTGSVENRTNGNHRTYVDLTKGEGAGAIENIDTIYDATNTLVGSDQIYYAPGGMIYRFVGRIYRVVSSVLHSAYVELGIDALGSTVISLIANHIHGVTEPRGTNNTTLATTQFVRDHHWIIPDDVGGLIQNGTLAWPGSGSWQTINAGMEVWRYRAQIDCFLQLKIGARFYYKGDGFHIHLQNAKGQGFIVGGTIQNVTTWSDESIIKTIPMRPGDEVFVTQRQHYPTNDFVFEYEVFDKA